MKRFEQWLNDTFTVLVLFISTGAFLTLLVDSSSVEAFARSPLLQTVWSVIYAIAIVRAYPMRRRIAFVLRKNRALLALMLLAGISFCWSADPAMTARRSIALVLGTFFAVDFGTRYSVHKQIQLVTCAIGAAIVLSAVADVFLPGMIPAGPTGSDNPDPSAWIGLFNHKNSYGHILALGVLCTMAHLRQSVISYVRTGLCLAMLFALIIGCDSRTSLVICLITIVQWPILQTLHWRPRSARTLGVAVLLMAVSGLVVCFEGSSFLASTIDRSSDLTGRTEVWQLALDSAAKRPMLGYGFDGFWSVTYDSARISDLLGWHIPSAHDGLLDVYIQLGLVGLLLFVFMTLNGLLRSIRFARGTLTPESLWPLACLLLILYNATTESYFLSSNSISWIIFVSALISVSAGDLAFIPESKAEAQMHSLPHPQLKDDTTYA